MPKRVSQTNFFGLPNLKTTGWKTYAIAILMAVFGGFWLLTPDSATWNSVSNQDVIGWLSLLLAGGFASVRHAITTSAKRRRRRNLKVVEQPKES